MSQSRNASPRPFNSAEIKISRNHTFLTAAVGKHLAPWIDNQRMTETLCAPVKGAVLAWRDHKAARFDGTRTVEDMPMGFAG